MWKKNYFQHPNALVSSKATVGDDTRIWAFVNVQAGAVIGRECNVCDGCYIEKGAVIGDHVILKNGVNVFEGVTIQDNVFCGANTAFTNDRHPRAVRRDPWVLEQTLVKKGASIGSNAVILCGITIGEYAVIGAGAIVTKSVGDYEIITGNPGRSVGYACRCGRKLSGDHFCAACRQQYIFSDNKLRIKE
ncbi:MAG: N-acetyltransferase [Candidatus Omnitrophica bacterium]|nr:N-acetyltransferase [Candidatus Omnitrophota bacterium]